MIKNILLIICFSVLFSTNGNSQTFKLQDSTFKVGSVFRTYNIIFNFDKFTFIKESYPTLDSLVTFLKKNDSLEIEIGFHNDGRGHKHCYSKYTRRRARAIYSYFVSKGISKNRLIPIGYEASKLVIKNAKTNKEHQVNRRAEFKIIKLQ